MSLPITATSPATSHLSYSLHIPRLRLQLQHHFKWSSASPARRLRRHHVSSAHTTRHATPSLLPHQPPASPRTPQLASAPTASHLEAPFESSRLETPSQSSHLTPSKPSHLTPFKSSRLENLRASPKPFSAFLTDSHARQHTYLRISLTERCNLRCTYCMPAAGVPLAPTPTQLTTPEITMLAGLFVKQGVRKIRLTGGEPTVRRDFVPLVRELGRLRTRASASQPGLDELCVTTNGLVLGSGGRLDALVDAGLTGVNLSLDTLDGARFEQMTRRRGHDRVLATLDRMLALNQSRSAAEQITIKINVVVLRGVNDDEIAAFARLTRDRNLEVRFIEYMPFDGNRWHRDKLIPYADMLAQVQNALPGLERLPPPSPNETSKTWAVPGCVGRVGFVTSMTEHFCASCNRLRITSDGNLKVCLFGQSEVSLRDVLRQESDGQPIDLAQMELMHRQAEQVIGRPLQAGEWLGSQHTHQTLLEIIGQAVGRKKARHAGMDVLQRTPNRPMILIDNLHTNPWKEPLHPLGQERHLRTARAKPRASFGPSLFQPQILGIPTRTFASSLRWISSQSSRAKPARLPHLNSKSEVHMVDVTEKTATVRSATAVGYVMFSQAATQAAIQEHRLLKGDVLAVARVAGIMAAKRVADLVPLCHSGLALEGVEVQLHDVGPAEVRETSPKSKFTVDGLSSERDEALETSLRPDADEHLGRLEVWLATGLAHSGGIRIAVTTRCTGKTGVEMEAIAGVVGAALTVVDMCKGIDRGCEMGGTRIVYKSGGRSGTWTAPGWNRADTTN